MTVRLYKSTDASAPTLNGTTGALCTVLDAVLVNGYGSQTAAGWTIAYTGTNLRAYRMATSGNTGFYLDVNDTAPVTAKEARVRGYEAMTALSTGTGPFPTTAQSTNGIFVRKSNTADSTARPWAIVADDSVFYLFTEAGDLTGAALAFMFGDFFSYKASDAYRCAIVGRMTENVATVTIENFLSGTFLSFLATNLGHYAARSYTALGGSKTFGKHFDVATGGNSVSANMYSGFGSSPGTGGVANLIYPNPPDNGLYLSPFWLHHDGAMRGYLKGIWCPLHYRPLGQGDTFTGTGNLAGKSFVVQVVQNADSTSIPGQVCIETSDTWS